MKRCGRCGETKPYSEFHVHNKKGYQSWCKKCRSAYAVERHAANPDERVKHNIAIAARIKAVKQEILAFQGGCCAICGTQIEEGNTDHDHHCEKHAGRLNGGRDLYSLLVVTRCKCVRGMLCSNCNSRIMAAIDSGLALPGPEVQHYLDNPPAQVYFALLDEREQDAQWKARLA